MGTGRWWAENELIHGKKDEHSLHIFLCTAQAQGRMSVSPQVCCCLRAHSLTFPDSSGLSSSILPFQLISPHSSARFLLPDNVSLLFPVRREASSGSVDLEGMAKPIRLLPDLSPCLKDNELQRIWNSKYQIISRLCIRKEKLFAYHLYL